MIRSSYLLFFVLSVWLLISCKPTPFAEGQRIYAAYCSNCHMDDGTGLAKLIPPLAGADYLLERQGNLACIILKGQQGPIVVNGVVYDEVMPAADLSAVQLHNVINYISNSWGNQAPYVTIEDVEAWTAECP